MICVTSPQPTIPTLIGPAIPSSRRSCCCAYVHLCAAISALERRCFVSGSRVRAADPALLSGADDVGDDLVHAGRADRLVGDDATLTQCADAVKPDSQHTSVTGRRLSF